MKKRGYIETIEMAWIDCWFHPYHPDLKRLPPRLWEPLRIKMQNIYREATGEEMATIIIKES